MQRPIDPNIDQQLQLLINAGIESQNECIQCHQKAHNLPGDSLRLTGCCWQFICAQDAAKISKDCPYCHKTFSTHKIALSNETVSMRFLDANGVELKISNYADYQALMKCETIKMAHSDASGIIDMRNNHPWITTANIQLLVEYIKNPRIICNQSIDRNKDMLQLANFMMTPENILHELSNILWEYLEEKETDSLEVTEEKTQLRGIAMPYLHCPAFLSKCVAAQHAISRVYSAHDLSYETISRRYAGHEWIQDKEGNWYNVLHKFVTLRGLKNILNEEFLIRKLKISGHNLINFSWTDVPEMYDEIDVSNNRIETIIIDGVTSQLPKTINLSHNRISSLDNSFFDTVKKHRSSGMRDMLTLDLRNNQLSDAEKKETEKKLYSVNYTLPERVNWNVIKKCITYPLYITIPVAFAYTNIPLLENSKFSKSDVTARTIADSFTGVTIANYYSNVITDGSGEFSPMAGACLGAYCAEGVFQLLDKDDNHRSKIVAGSMFAGVCLSTAAFPLLVKLRNKIVDSFASRLARITHPTIQARTFSDLERAKRVIVKL